jgi:hypothetical protein
VLSHPYASAMREKLFAARIKDFNAADAEKSDTPSAEEKQEVFDYRNCIFVYR